MSSRDLILGRVRQALVDVPGDEATYEQAVSRDYLRVHGSLSTAETVDLLAENLADYRAIVHRSDPGGLPALLARLLGARGEPGARRVLVPPGLPAHWLDAADATPVPDEAGHTAHELDEVDSVVTGCAVAIAETGTLVLDGSPIRGVAASP